MTAPTHIAFGLFCSSVVASFFEEGRELGLNETTVAAICSVFFGTIVPDIDHDKSFIGRALPYLSQPVRRRWPHRTLTHSLFGCAIVVALFYSLLRGCEIWWQGNDAHFYATLFMISYLSHLVLDTMTFTGIRWLYPMFRPAFGYPSVDQFRCSTGDQRVEIPITVLSLVFATLLFPIAKTGADISLGNAIGKFEQLKAIYLSAVNKEVILHYDGYFASNKAQITGEGVILNVTQSAFTVATNGAVLLIGEEEGDILLLRGSCRFLEQLPKEDVILFHKTQLPDILNNAGDRLMSGQLEANGTFTVEQPSNDASILVSSSKLALTFAAGHNIAALDIHPSGTSADERKQTLTALQSKLTDLLLKHQHSQDLLTRDSLYADISSARRQIKTVQDMIEKAKLHTGELLFSGKVALRSVPSITNP